MLFDCLLQIRCILQDVQLTDQQRFKQFVSQSKAGMEVTEIKVISTL